MSNVNKTKQDFKCDTFHVHKQITQENEMNIHTLLNFCNFSISWLHNWNLLQCKLVVLIFIQACQ